ncbi:MAG: hypothetical protein B6D39_02320 [Anaerolineae bacterium UTCFX2]|jgi:asparagine synthase (glutamine-hydrolysing)|nr:MAG: hypothetical protein B6D39_02320 [Anaerolineae bacterium UTCFX2]
MPGLIGYLTQNPKENSGLTIKAMADLLQPEPRFTRELYEEGPLGLGRVSLGILNPQPQPAWSEDHTLAVILEGEFYNAPELVKALESHGYAAQDMGDAQIALRLYQDLGEDFANRLNGAFVLAIWDARQRKLLITNDRLGLYPLYYAQTAQGFSFASGVRALLADPALPRRPDRVGIAQFLTFDHLLDDHTLLDSAKLLPQASLLTLQDGRLQIRPYWKLQYTEQHELRDIEQEVERLNHLLEQAVRRQTRDDLPKGLLLSGGLDSRMLLAELAETLPAGQLDTFTWGIPGCDDCRAARELAAIAKARHHFYKLGPEWLAEKAEEAVRLTDGLGNVINLHAIAAAPQEGAISRVLFKGFLGDAMFGFAIVRRFWANYDAQNAFAAHLSTHRELGVITFDPPEHASLFTPDFQNAVGDAVFESYRAGMKRSGASQLATQRLYFDLTQRVPRMTINGVEVVRAYAAARLPFADYDLLDFSFQLPPGYTFERYIAYRAFTEKFARYAKVPNPVTGLPLISCARDILLRGRDNLRWHLQARGLDKLLGPESRPYKDYNGWFRRELRGWVEGLLLDPHSLDRGFFQPEYIRQVVSAHMAGKDLATHLGALLSLELWLRQYLD